MHRICSRWDSSRRHRLRTAYTKNRFWRALSPSKAADGVQAKYILLTHGHYDHGGGLQKFLQINEAAPVYVSRWAFEPHYNISGKYLGMDTSLQKNPRIYMFRHCLKQK